MRRRNAYLIIGGLFLSISTYLLWAGRPFLIRPGIVFEPDVPAKEKKIVNEWVKESGGFGPERFRWDRFLHLLTRPYEDGVIPVVAEFSDGDSFTPDHVVRIRHPRKPYTVRITVNRLNSNTSITFH